MPEQFEEEVVQEEEVVEEPLVEEDSPSTEDDEVTLTPDQINSYREIWLYLRKHHADMLHFVELMASRLNNDPVSIISFFIHMMEFVGAFNELKFLRLHLIRAATSDYLGTNLKRSEAIMTRQEKLARAIYKQMTAGESVLDNFDTDVDGTKIKKLTPDEVKGQKAGLPPAVLDADSGGMHDVDGHGRGDSRKDYDHGSDTQTF